MTRLHDMGGRYGDGPVRPGDGAVYEQDWHARAMALTLACGALGQWTLDASRHARESLPPRDYAAFSYYEKWLAALADLLVRSGTITPEECAGGPAALSPLSPRKLTAQAVPRVLAAGAPTLRDGPAPRFSPQDRVRTRRPARNVDRPGGHTRLPGYCAGVAGRILLSHGCHILPDAHAHGGGECPEPLYTVVFDAADLWGTPERAGDTVTCDLWESYLSPAAS